VTTAADRALRLKKDARTLRDFYQGQGGVRPVLLFAEDFDWLDARGELDRHAGAIYLDGIQIRRGPRKKRPRKKRPPELFSGITP